jgi:predicted dithiol-disulfide oxidoreductase (DUF899 family)
MTEAPGISIFCKGPGRVDLSYLFLFRAGAGRAHRDVSISRSGAQGRDEDNLPYTMEWVRHYDRYEDQE